MAQRVIAQGNGHGTVNAGRISTTATPEMTGHTEANSPSAPAHAKAHVGALLGRLLIAPIFIMSGIYKFMDLAGTEGAMREGFQRAIDWYQCPANLAEMTMSALPTLAMIAAAVEIAAGVGLLLGLFTRCSAATLFLFLIATTLIFHGFWMFGDAERQVQMINFMKNLAIMGGLSVLVSFGPGKASVDGGRCP